MNVVAACFSSAAIESALSGVRPTPVLGRKGSARAGLDFLIADVTVYGKVTPLILHETVWPEALACSFLV
jgi:hypothetical protein